MNRYLLVATPEELYLPAAINAMYDRTVIITGPAAMDVIRACKDLPRDSDVLNVGYAGSPDITPGTEVWIIRSKLWHPNAGVFKNEPCVPLPASMYADILQTAECYTAGDFVTSAEGLPLGCVVDMELAYIAAFGFTHLTAIKYVSDNLNKAQYDQCLKKLTHHTLTSWPTA